MGSSGGLKVGKTIFAFRKKHTKKIDIEFLAHKMDDSIELYRNEISNVWETMSGEELDLTRGNDIINELFDTEEIMAPCYKENIEGQWLKESNDKEQLNLWDLYNCFTWVLTHTIAPKYFQRSNVLGRKIYNRFKKGFTL